MLTVIRDFATSMAGRIFAVLAAGIVASSLLSATIAGVQRRSQAESARLDRIVDRAASVAFANGPVPGGRVLASRPQGGTPDADLTRRLRERYAWAGAASAFVVDRDNCGPVPPRHAGGRPGPPPPPLDPGPRATCYLLDLASSGSPARFIAVDGPPALRDPELPLSPVFIFALTLCAFGLAVVVSRMAARPIAQLGIAAAGLSRSLDAPALALEGPSDVRQAIAAFNTMQADLKHTLDERTRMLAAISHDLRSPLTRLRLRLDAVTEDTLRTKLVADANAMRELIEEGLELARAASHLEPLVRIDVTALLQSLVDDAVDIGHAVSLTAAPRVIMPSRPAALRRIVTNLIDNAVRYGGSAEIELQPAQGGARITIADRGAGLREADLDRVFDPFVRLETSRSPETGGTGLGLTIGRMLARQIGAELTLANRAGGGLVATLLARSPTA
ncbi:hypothetical protein KX816_01675 [Sphingosinicellaceae bacterium]|nr:hypothetical protein KX816_01675 [Sphingosinicellaceae bacterium]